MSLTTDRNNPCLKETRADGQQECYLVLSEEERAKGFIRPVRQEYRHVGLAKPENELRDLTPDEHERYDQYGYVKYEKYPEGSNALGRFWTATDLAKIDGGCKQKTHMGMALAETYAREPSFYGSTFCVTCCKHLPVAEFVWLDGSRLGS
jgi:hypothetical protein